jgi:hypothetical protein
MNSSRYRKREIISFLTFSLFLLGVAAAYGLAQDNDSSILIVNSDPDDPAVPLDLSLSVRVLGSKRLLEVKAQVGKKPSYPSELFFDKDVKVHIELPAGLKLQEGSLTWQGDIKGNEVKEIKAGITALRDMEGAVIVSAYGRTSGGGMDADTEQFYIRTHKETMEVSLNPFTPIDLSKPGTAVQTK